MRPSFCCWPSTILAPYSRPQLEIHSAPSGPTSMSTGSNERRGTPWSSPGRPRHERSPPACRRPVTKPLPCLAIHQRLAAQPVIINKHVTISLRPTRMIEMNGARAGAFKKGPGRGRRGQVLVTFPIVTPRVPPAKVRAEKGRKQLVAVRLIVIRSEPREGVIKADIPWITKTARHNLQIGAIHRATQNAAGQAPIIARDRDSFSRRSRP